MTALATRSGEPTLDGQGDALGPIASFGARFFVFAAFLFAFQVTGFAVLPGLTPVALLAGAFGVLLLAPRLVLMRVPISIVVLMMIGWMLASTLWTDSPEGTAFAVQRDIPILFGLMLVVGMISLEDLVSALLWAIRAGVAFTVVVVATLPQARVHIDPTGQTPDLAGWHGLFPHKNIMTPFLVFALLTVLTFDRTRLLRWVTLAAIAVLIVGSDSVTGMSSALLAVSVWVWLQLYRHLEVRNSSIFLISSVSVAVFGMLGILASLSTLTSASGRDLTFTGRTFIWQATFEAFLERPLLGYGLGGIFFTDPISPRTAEVWRAIGFRVPHAHNGLLGVAVQLGIVGAVLFTVLFVTTMVGGVAMVRARPKVAAWIVSTMIVQLYISLSENVFIGSGWLAVLVMFRVLLMRKHDMELATGVQLVERLRRPGTRQR